MDKKKIFSIVGLSLVLVIVIVILIVILGKTPQSIIVTKPLNENVVLENVFESINELEDSGFSGEAVDFLDEIDFKEYTSLEKMAYGTTNDVYINEVWLVKLGAYEQQEEVCRIFGNRIQKLKNAFKDDLEQMSIINNAIVKQEDGIVIVIISKDAEEIEETISKEMKK